MQTNQIKKGKTQKLNRPGFKKSDRRSKSTLIPVTVSGVIVPLQRDCAQKVDGDFKLVCPNGSEYLIVTDSQWGEVLTLYRWEEIEVVGLLNTSDMTLIPQKVFPKGPKGEKERLIDLANWHRQSLIKKVIKNLNDLVVTPTEDWLPVAA